MAGCLWGHVHSVCSAQPGKRAVYRVYFLPIPMPKMLKENGWLCGCKHWPKVKNDYVIVEIQLLQNYPTKAKLHPDSTLPGKTKSKKQQRIIFVATKNHKTTAPCRYTHSYSPDCFPFPPPPPGPRSQRVPPPVGCHSRLSLTPPLSSRSKLGAAGAPLPSTKVKNILKTAGIRINSSSVQQFSKIWCNANVFVLNKIPKLYIKPWCNSSIQKSHWDLGQKEKCAPISTGF